jgi:hypothetical protein
LVSLSSGTYYLFGTFRKNFRSSQSSEGQLLFPYHCFLFPSITFLKVFHNFLFFFVKKKARVKYFVLQQTIERYPSVRVGECDVKLEGKYHMASKSYHFGLEDGKRFLFARSFILQVSHDVFFLNLAPFLICHLLFLKSQIISIECCQTRHFAEMCLTVLLFKFFLLRLLFLSKMDNWGRDC